MIQRIRIKMAQITTYLYRLSYPTNLKESLWRRLPLLSFSVVLAGSNNAEQITIKPPSILPSGLNFSTFLSGLIGMIIIIAFIAAFIYLLWGGFTWITSGGDEAGITAARQRIINALIGLTIVVAVWALFQLVEAFLGVTIFGAGGFKVPGIAPGTAEKTTVDCQFDKFAVCLKRCPSKCTSSGCSTGTWRCL